MKLYAAHYAFFLFCFPTTLLLSFLNLSRLYTSSSKSTPAHILFPQLALTVRTLFPLINHFPHHPSPEPKKKKFNQPRGETLRHFLPRAYTPFRPRLFCSFKSFHVFAPTKATANEKRNERKRIEQRPRAREKVRRKDDDLFGKVPRVFLFLSPPPCAILTGLRE